MKGVIRFYACYDDKERSGPGGTCAGDRIFIAKVIKGRMSSLRSLANVSTRARVQADGEEVMAREIDHHCSSGTQLACRIAWRWHTCRRTRVGAIAAADLFPLPEAGGHY